MQISKELNLIVIGAGNVGMSIIEAFARQGFNVIGIDLSEEVINRGRGKAEKSIAKSEEKGKISSEERVAVLRRIQMTTDFEVVRDADVVIEAVFENMEVKKELFKRLDNMVKSEEALLLTNTSSLSVSEIASATKRPDKVAGMHFFNPVPVMKLVEVIRGVESSADTISKVAELSELMEKRPIICTDSPGFVVNRLLHILAVEASKIVEEGVATARDVDTGAKLGLGHPMGPFEVFDFFDGVPLLKTVCDYLETELGSRFKVPVWVKNYLRAGRTGRSCGKGFHDYTQK
ncbi:3-hydroxyacyl-CoA dehydrogenase family protein [Desulfatiglans anilini]|uniref:3-hydroxyacyl-CoA dehydrogenase family protein n=1 Tax=Desulfatiglans anilini TaxID=90728 RepID=UPI0003F5E567|nr:3-hydroxyacyl-CoA dehydrogenase family protein [Desulfatiglans anilini]